MVVVPLPGDQSAENIAFTHGGGQLVIPTNVVAVHLCSLHVFRKRPAAQGLDWDGRCPRSARTRRTADPG